MNRRTVFVCVALAATITATTAAARPGGQGGFKTAQPAMLTAVAPDVTVTPLMTVGDVLPSGYRFESIPDGISRPSREGRGASTSTSTTRRARCRSRTTPPHPPQRTERTTSTTRR